VVSLCLLRYLGCPELLILGNEEDKVDEYCIGLDFANDVDTLKCVSLVLTTLKHDH